MNWTSENRQQVQRLIDAIPDGETYHDFDSWDQPNFRQLNVLPVLFDAGGASVLCPDGAWKRVLWDQPNEIADMTCFDDRIERGLKFETSQKYPTLEWLIPKRQLDSVDCPNCGGDGISPTTNNGATNVVCWCGGLGWVPANE